jgi:hypothetical protein
VKFFGAWPEFGYSKGLYSWQEDGQKHTFDARETFESWAEDVKRRKQIAESPF